MEAADACAEVAKLPEVIARCKKGCILSCCGQNQVAYLPKKRGIDVKQTTCDVNFPECKIMRRHLTNKNSGAKKSLMFL